MTTSEPMAPSPVAHTCIGWLPTHVAGATADACSGDADSRVTLACRSPIFTATFVGNDAPLSLTVNAHAGTLAGLRLHSRGCT